MQEGVSPAAAGTRVLLMHDRTDLQRLTDDLSVARTLTAALRSQTHEHANRLHTALSLVEAGRLESAKRVLSHRPQSGADKEDVAEALLRAKGAQAAEAGVVLTAEVEVVCDAAGLVVQVADGGPGPSAADLERIFSSGFSTKPAGAAGRGVGLPLVRGIVEAAGGTVEVATDSGTVVTAEVPPVGGPAARTAPVDAADAAAPHAPGDDHADAAPEGAGGKEPSS